MVNKHRGSSKKKNTHSVVLCEVYRHITEGASRGDHNMQPQWTLVLQQHSYTCVTESGHKHAGAFSVDRGYFTTHLHTLSCTNTMHIHVHAQGTCHKDFQPTAPVFKAGHLLSYSFVLFHWMGGSWVYIYFHVHTYK